MKYSYYGIEKQQDFTSDVMKGFIYCNLAKLYTHLKSQNITSKIKRRVP
jgi:hypothetical protein